MQPDRIKTLAPPILPALALALLIATTSGCGRSSPAAPQSEVAVVPEVLKVIRPERQNVRRIIEEPGQIEAYEHTPIYAHIPGYVSEVCVDMDARVSKGDVLARLWVPEMADDVREKEARVAKARAGLEQAQQAFHAAEAHCRTAETLVAQAIAERKRARADCERWQSEYQRIEELVRDKSIDVRLRDERLNQFKAAEAACDEVEAKIRSAEAARDESVALRLKAEADVKAARTHMHVAEAEAQRAKTMLDYTEVKAPFTGVVTRRNVHTGHLLRPGPSGQGEPLFLVVRRDRVRIFVEVPEAEAPFVRQGVPLRLRIQALNDREFEATVTRTSWALDPASRTLRAEMEVPNATDELRPGMYAYAIITAEHPNAFTLPAEALIRQEDTNFCYQVIEGKAVQTLVRPGMRVGSRREVLKKRLAGPDDGWQDFTGAEQVLLGNVAALANGEDVSIAAAN
jgi:HlyD family secretion protein